MNSPTLLTSHFSWAGDKPSGLQRKTLKVNTIWTQIHFLLWQLFLVPLKAWQTLGCDLYPSAVITGHFLWKQSVLAGLCYGRISLTQPCLKEPKLRCHPPVLTAWCQQGTLKGQPTSSSNPSAPGILLYPKTCKFLSHGSFLPCPPGLCHPLTSQRPWESPKYFNPTTHSLYTIFLDYNCAFMAFTSSKTSCQKLDMVTYICSLRK